MSTKLKIRNFYVPESYTFKFGHENPSAIISLTPCVSSSNYVGSLRPYYQQRKFSLTSTAPSLLLSVGIHTIDDDLSSLKDEYSSLSLDKV
jgi:hypothetical protein